ncbi:MULTISPECIES: AAA family ATPase [unclassified Mesorhizobium]|uniref:AAA family ATPase n=1 Tax=unclassified Mesorhizobium TaxID=325217 RepID=UPI0003CE0466|nr:AAA family ATPase [Mesorhizobium sp. LNJC391B00]ESY19178.1 RecA-family ATPase [Mesorhizobium sp. LNJC391B00]
MTNPNAHEMMPFELPAGFGDGFVAAVEFVGVDEREHALDCLSDYADILFGDIVLVPFKDGEPDWANTTRDTIEKFAGHWSEIGPEDVPRLGILTDGFARFLDDVEGVSVVTLWREGTPIIRQIEGKPCGAALDIIMDAIVDDEPLTVRPTDATGKGRQEQDDDTYPKPIKASPFLLGDPSAIPPRQWLFGSHYIRKYLTSTVGAGGGGKSAHAVSEALAMATGRPLLGPDGPLGRKLGVWYINVEDPRDEIERRFAAAALHFGITNEQIDGRLFTDSGRDHEFVIMRQAGKDFKVCAPLVNAMVAEIKANAIDVVIVDPFVSTHEVPENDNSAIQRVAKAWQLVAERGDCCVEVIHHVVKGAEEITADSGRGGGALKDKARSVRTINGMTQAEATKAGVEDRREYFRIDLGKVNMTKSMRSQWRRFESVGLGNGGTFSQGDSVGVVVPWCWPSADTIAEKAEAARVALVADVPADMLAGIKVRLHSSHYKESPQAGNWAGKLVAEIFSLDAKADREQIKAMLAAWIDAGELEIVDIMDAYRHLKPHIKPAAAP